MDEADLFENYLSYIRILYTIKLQILSRIVSRCSILFTNYYSFTLDELNELVLTAGLSSKSELK